MKTGYVENAIHEYKERLIDAYASIEVIPKNGYEDIPACIELNEGEKMRYHGLKALLLNYEDNEIWLTDDIISIESEYNAISIIKAIAEANNGIIVHLCVSELSLTQVEDFLEKALKTETQDDLLALHWLYEDRSFMLYLNIRKNSTRIRIILYEDGNGCVLHDSINDLQIFYFKISEEKQAEIIKNTIEKVDYIVSNPVYVHEDDRFLSFPVFLEYGLEWRYIDPEHLHKDDEVFENCDYEYNLYDNPMVREVVFAPEVSEILKNLNVNIN